jgi:hypothetical protein
LEILVSFSFSFSFSDVISFSCVVISELLLSSVVLFLVLVSAVAFTVLGVAIDCPGEKVTRARRAVSVDDSQDPLAGLAANYSGISYSWSIDDLSGCALNDVFNVSFVVFDHIWLKFEPVKPPASVDCQTFIFDSQIYVDEANVTYSVGILQTLPPTVSANQNLSEAFTHSFLLGKYVRYNSEIFYYDGDN